MSEKIIGLIENKNGWLELIQRGYNGK